MYYWVQPTKNYFVAIAIAQACMCGGSRPLYCRFCHSIFVLRIGSRESDPKLRHYKYDQHLLKPPPIHTPPPTDPGVSPKWTPPSSLTSSSSSPSPSATSWTGPASSGYSRVSRDRDALATVSPKLGIPTNICIEYYNPVKLMYAFCNYQYHCKLTVWRWLSR